MMSALICSLARAGAQLLPALDSLIPPVRGDLAPAETRPDEGAVVPVVKPGAKMRLLFGYDCVLREKIWSKFMN